jgi:hypothetical protein
MELKAATKLPEAPDNGFEELTDSEIERKARVHGRFVTVTVWDVSNGGIDYDTGERSFKFRPRSIEIMTGADADQAIAMHDRVHGARTGEVTLGVASGDAS